MARSKQTPIRGKVHDDWKIRIEGFQRNAEKLIAEMELLKSAPHLPRPEAQWGRYVLGGAVCILLGFLLCLLLAYSLSP